MVFGVIAMIPDNLPSPKCRVVLRPVEEGAVVSMPEATVNKNDRLVLLQHDIRAPWKVALVQSVAVTKGK